MNTRVDVAVLRQVLNKPFLGIDDICIVLNCSKSKAFAVKKSVLEFAHQKQVFLHSNRVIPTAILIEFLNHDMLTAIYNAILKN